MPMETHLFPCSRLTLSHRSYHDPGTGSGIADGVYQSAFARFSVGYDTSDQGGGRRVEGRAGRRHLVSWPALVHQENAQ